MNREELKALGLTEDQIETVMKSHGKAIQAVKPDDYEDLKSAKDIFEKQIADLQDTLKIKETELGSVDDLKKEVETYKLKDLKTSVAIQAGIPLELAGRLSGSNEDEIKADAEKMAGFVNKKQTLPLRTTEPPKADAAEEAYEKMIENL